MAQLQVLASLALLASFAVVATNGQSCPDKFNRVGSTCTQVSTQYLEDARPTLISWHDARKACQNMSDSSWQVDLVSNYDVRTLRLISLDIINNYPRLFSGKFIYWVGAELVDSEWQWLDGTPIDPSSYIWYISAPSNEYLPGSHALLVPAGPRRQYTYVYGSRAYSPSFICEARPNN